MPSGRTDTLTSNRSEPFSISASEMPSSTTVWRRSWRNRFGVRRRSGGRVRSRSRRSGVPARLKSTSACVRARDAALGAADVDVLGGVLLEVRADDADLELAVRGRQRVTCPSTQRARRTGRSGSPSAGRDRSSACGGRWRARRLGSRAPRPRRIVISIARLFGTGSAPGSARQTGQVREFAGAEVRARSGRTSSSSSSGGRGSRGR